MAQKRRSNRGKGGAKSKKVPPVTAYLSGEAPLPLAARLRLTDASVVETAAAADTESANITTPAAVFETVGALEANATIPAGVGEKPISIVPTNYPQEPGGSINVQNHITTINIQGNDFRKFKGTMVDLHEALRGANAIGSNAIGSEVRQQFIAETSAGTALLEAPKANRGLIDLLLIRPLTWLSTIAGAGERVAELALVALDLLNKMIG